MSPASARITGMGIVSAAGTDRATTLESLAAGRSGLAPLSHFPTPSHNALPVGSVPLKNHSDALPRAHQLARAAADQALGKSTAPPDAIVIGVTTGGMDLTETCLLTNSALVGPLPRHSLSSVAEDLADRFQCTGPLLTVSTACSSGAVAIKLALEMIRAGQAQRVLAGGTDALCRLIYYGFKSLQLLDPAGARPLDQNRRGMSVAEGAAMLLLESSKTGQPGVGILGAGLSCDAYHPARPHPEGMGALAAMQAALRDAGLEKDQIDYISLHGTGTIDNDLAEARAVKTLFGKNVPPHSSIKGATGHTLAAAGALEAVVATLCINNQILPGNTGCKTPDKALDLMPCLQPQQQPIQTVLSNSFGFGGNNAALIIGTPQAAGTSRKSAALPVMTISGWSAITGAGDLQDTMDSLTKAQSCRGCFDTQDLAQKLPPALIRRLKRLPVMALSLADTARKHVGGQAKPDGIFFGTGLGCLSETGDFLDRLFSTHERFASPTDFVGSVHNAAAGQIAMHFESTGANLTLSGEDSSFEQALSAAGLLTGAGSAALVLGADEGHNRLSTLFDPSTGRDEPLADGGGALWLSNDAGATGPSIALTYYAPAPSKATASMATLVNTIDREQPAQERYALIMAGMPAAYRRQAEAQLVAFLGQAGFCGPVVDYRALIGEFQSASAVAAVIAAECIQRGTVPANLCTGYNCQTGKKGVLILGLGKFITAMEVMSQ